LEDSAWDTQYAPAGAKATHTGAAEGLARVTVVPPSAGIDRREPPQQLPLQVAQTTLSLLAATPCSFSPIALSVEKVPPESGARRRPPPPPPLRPTDVQYANVELMASF
jgi:hypothetical protein